MGCMTLVYERSPKALLWMLGYLSAALLYYAVFEGLWCATAARPSAV